MPVERLSPLDASFLAVETPIAHMHVGWAARFAAPADRPRPSFAELFAHVAARLGRSPRLRRRLAPVPFGLHAPEWVDDDTFDPWDHVLCSSAVTLSDLADDVMSAPLARDKPLWQIWIADRLADGTIGMVGKAHHCMVDGIAAVELGTLLLDLEPEPRPVAVEPAPAADEAHPAAPSRLGLLVRGIEDRARDAAGLAAGAAGIALDVRRLAAAPRVAERLVRTVLHAALPAAPETPLNRDGSPERHLATLHRPLEQLDQVKRRWRGTTVNDVVLAACAGALRAHALRHGRGPQPLKAMVPVNVRDEGQAAALGNRISFMFVELPCDEPDPVMRLLAIHRTTAERKRLGEPDDADGVLRALGRAPRTVQHVAAHLVAAPRMYNLAVSNIPGLPMPVFLRGCRLLEAYPVVPLAERHAVSIGMTTIDGRACFGIYADRATLPDADALAGDLGDALDELVAGASSPAWARRPGKSGRRSPGRRSPARTAQDRLP